MPPGNAPASTTTSGVVSVNAGARPWRICPPWTFPPTGPARLIPAAPAPGSSDRCPTTCPPPPTATPGDNRVSFLAVLHAALLIVLHRYTGRTDLPVGSVFSGRTRTDIEPLVGYFANTVVLRTHLDGNPTFADLIRRCHDTVLDASAHQDIPFSLIVDTLQPDRVPGRNPLFQISLTLQPAPAHGELSLGTLVAEPVDTTTGEARFDIAIDIAETPDGHLAISAEYSTELFDPDRIQRLLDHYATALAHGLAHPETLVQDVDILGPMERRQVLDDWNPPATPYHAGLLHQVIIGHDPDSVAIRFQGVELTYAELRSRSSRLAHALREHGVGPGHIVALLLDRGLHLPVAQIAVMTAGAAWTMLDPQHPPARLGFHGRRRRRPPHPHHHRPGRAGHRVRARHHPLAPGRPAGRGPHRPAAGHAPERRRPARGSGLPALHLRLHRPTQRRPGPPPRRPLLLPDSASTSSASPPTTGSPRSRTRHSTPASSTATPPCSPEPP